jgi:hypothetical protein
MLSFYFIVLFNSIDNANVKITGKVNADIINQTTSLLITDNDNAIGCIIKRIYKIYFILYSF